MAAFTEDAYRQESVESGRGNAFDLRAYKLLVSSLFSSPASIIPGGIAGIIAVHLCRLSTGEPVFGTLTSIVTLVVILRVLLVIAYRGRSHEQDDLAVTRIWDRLYFVGATLFSAVLSFSCYYALTETEVAAAHVTAVSTTIAFASGYVSRNAGRPGFVALQLLTFCVPLAVGLIQAHDVYYQYVGYFVFLYMAANIAITNSLHRNLLALSDATKRSEGLASALHSQNLTLDAALNTMLHGLAMFDRRLNLAVCNTTHAAFYGLPDTLTLPGTPFQATARFLLDRKVLDRAQLRDIRNALAQVRRSQTPQTCELRSSHGRILVVTIAPAAEGGLLMATEDATERKATEARIERMARFDELTGLANRFSFNAALAEAFAHRDEPAAPFALLYLDLDGFKQVNDSLGHDFGDRLLKETADRLAASIRPGDLLARFGGDEFVMILPGASQSTVTLVAQRLIDIMNRAFVLDGRTVYVTASIGIAIAPEDGAKPADLLRHADAALYKAKASGRNTLAFFNPTMAQEILDRHEIAVALREACEQGELELHYQPIIDIETRRIISREALMRWRHPTRGMIPPAVFIPIAEESGLIATMGDWAIRRACLDAAGWEKDVSVSVNVSPIQFREPHRLDAAVKDALLEAGLASSRLTLEVTESVLVEDERATLEAMQRLRRLGVRFALDDFGTGYSSLGYLAAYPFSQVKIDQRFSRNILSDPASKAIIEAVCQLARRLSLNVVVEGIETEQQRIAVHLLGARQAQGYLFGRPAPCPRQAEAPQQSVA